MTPSVRTGEPASAPAGVSPAGSAPAVSGTTTSRPDLPLPDDGRTVLVGQAPSCGDGGYPLFPHPKGCTGHRLSCLAGVTPWRYLRKFVRLNVFYSAPGPSGYWPTRQARERAAEITPHLRDRRVIFVGRMVARAFGWADPPLLEWHPIDLGGVRLIAAVVPHPSGRNRWYNDPDNRAAAARFMAAEEARSPPGVVRHA